MVTHTVQLKGQASYNKAQVMWLCNMDESSYYLFMGQTAIEWLHRHGKEVMPDNELFRKWWRRVWQEADNNWILPELYQTSAKLSLYRMMHQYVFDETDINQQMMVADFNNLRESFNRPVFTGNRIKPAEAKGGDANG